jgi:hypothetical protein
MLHYLVTSQNYNAFVNIQRQIEKFANTEDISALCGKKPHPFHTWLTKNVLTIVKLEILAFICAFVVLSSLAVYFNLSVGIWLLLVMVSFLFSVWVSGLAGAELLQHYLQCQDATQDKERLLALYIEINDNDLPQFKSLLDVPNNMTVVKLD